MSCYPTYPYTPTFVPSAISCTAPTYQLHRSRVAIIGSGVLLTTDLFFRSKNQRNDANDIEVELVDIPTPRVNIYFQNTLVKVYLVTTYTIGSIASLRNQIEVTDPNPYLEMPEVAFDVYDVRATEPDGDGVTEAGLGLFARVPLTGGQGAPEDGSLLSSIRTGPTRTIFITRSYEDIAGEDQFPPASERVKQWDGTMWISYCNNIQGACPGEGTC